MKNLKSKFELDEILKAERYVILYFTANWCGPCQMMKPILEWVEQSYSKITVVAVNVDQFQRLYKEDYKVKSIPDIRFIESGKEVRKFVGVPMMEEFRKAVREFLGLSVKNLLGGEQIHF